MTGARVVISKRMRFYSTEVRLRLKGPAAVDDLLARTMLRDHAPLILLLLASAILAQAGVGAMRPLFVVGCVGVAAIAFRRGGLALHVQTAIPLFVFSPLLRRMLDVHTGYDPAGSMLLGPLLALAAVFPTLARLFSRRSAAAATLIPFLVATLCVVYGWSIAAFDGDIVISSATALKYEVPMLYCVCIMLIPDQSNIVLSSAAKAFFVVSPIIGLYGIWQNLSPQPWDRYWMIASKIDSIGLPEAGKVRVFGTMNSPVSFAAYATCGLLLFTFVRTRYVPPILVPLAVLPLCLSLLLSAVRTAWISAALSLIVCVYFKETRRRAIIFSICIVLSMFIIITFMPFGDSIISRLSSMANNVSDDGSGSARIDDYFHVFGGDSRYIFGVGFGGRSDTSMTALDGLLLSSAVEMGTGFGVLHVAAVLWAGVQAVLSVRRGDDIMRLVACAITIGSLAIFILTNIAIGEIGFLYWMMVGCLMSKQPRR